MLGVPPICIVCHDDGMATSRIVCIDIEPGGKTSPRGSIGVCEIEETGAIGKPFHIEFASPLSPLVRDTDFPEVWAFIDAYATGAVVVAYSARYDRAALRRLIAAVPSASFDPPEIRCALEAARRIPGIPSVGSLSDAVVRLELFSPAEVDIRRRRFFDEHYGSKWLLNDAADDALACARLVAKLSAHSGQSPTALLHPVSPRPVR